ncbi:uncharacterized protein LOC121372603 [Gigantopelta aegis]|uniref:uncharacterized protein LOC121372603 n=1 Tax=Gigantopelta aegis TaxID=1735272 RepID=UPI001B88BFEB|nr:uncharacterized protein LOC121372603 [Gigantopelta aegis]
MEAPVRIVLFTLYTLLTTVQGDLVVQGTHGCGSSQYPKEVRITDRNEETIFSQTNQYYDSRRDCILTIIGKRNYQLQLELTSIDIDQYAFTTEHCGGLCCTDYLKIFNSYRVDNARLLPGMSQWGMCGNELPKRTIWQTTNNFVTIQFRTDERTDYKRGFTMRFKQYPWRNPGNVFPDGGYFGGWNDGSKKELQVDWSDQSQIPGDFVPPGGDGDYDGGSSGIQCYECQGCDVDYFDPDSEFASVQAGCYTCSKTWRDQFASAQRRCFTKIQYTNLLLTLSDPSVGGGKVTEFRGCRRFLDAYGVFLNYCFCDGNLCNSAKSLRLSGLSLLCFFTALILSYSL